ncbi:hypothetical protein AMTR_s00117p00108080 [Amborella trichopoda]|uniref:Uncharacterized protein n=1 Tax=Amborella trichopoda TaxID=13333 RepID=W1NR38_AMBTC|nr:hypothetical protein AMTR_s00117p00108080 [Amborella trichopoda]
MVEHLHQHLDSLQGLGPESRPQQKTSPLRRALQIRGVSPLYARRGEGEASQNNKRNCFPTRSTSPSYRPTIKALRFLSDTSFNHTDVGHHRGASFDHHSSLLTPHLSGTIVKASAVNSAATSPLRRHHQQGMRRISRCFVSLASLSSSTHHSTNASSSEHHLDALIPALIRFPGLHSRGM